MVDKFDYGFREISAPFVSASQSARVRTEDWVAREMYCPACGERALHAMPNNAPVGDFACEACREEYELKASMKAFGPKVVDGAYATMIARLEGQFAPNLLLMRYDKRSSMVMDVEAIPSQFFTPRIIERRKPLAPTARRAGWVGCNILVSQIPSIGRIPVIEGQVARPVREVTAAWAKVRPFTARSLTARGWLFEVLNCVDRIPSRDFTLSDVYAFERELTALYPGNQNVRPKIRQQLQVLRDMRLLEFLGGGVYRKL